MKRDALICVIEEEALTGLIEAEALTDLPKSNFERFDFDA